MKSTQYKIATTNSSGVFGCGQGSTPAKALKDSGVKSKFVRAQMIVDGAASHGFIEKVGNRVSFIPE